MNFIKYFFGYSFLFFALCAALIISIDPYEKYGINVFGFKTKAVMFGREVKYHMFDNAKENYEAFILGSSAAHRYRTSDMKELSGLNSFNYTVQSAMPEDYLAITRHIIKKSSPKVIMIQVDFNNLNKNVKVDPRLYNSPLKDFLSKNNNNYFDAEITNTYLTLSALWDSLRVIGVNAFGEPKHAYLEHGNYPKEKKVTGKIKIHQNNYKNYEFDSARIKMLSEIRKIADENGIKLVAITAPVSFEHFRSIEKQGKSKELFDFKNILRTHFHHVYDFTNSGIKDYSNTEYFRDSTHITPKFARLVLEVVFGKKELKELGRELSSTQE